MHDAVGADGCGGKGTWRNHHVLGLPLSPSPSVSQQCPRRCTSVGGGGGGVSVPFALEDLSARGTPHCILGHLGYLAVIGRSLYFATPTTCLCHSAPLLLCLLPLIICIRFSDYLLSPSCIFLPDVVSPSSHPLPLIKDSLRDFSLLTGG